MVLGEEGAHLAGEPGLVAAGSVLAEHSLGNRHIESLLGNAEQLLCLSGITGFGSLDGVSRSRLQFRPDRPIALIAFLVLAIALYLGLDVCHTEKTS